MCKPRGVWLALAGIAHYLVLGGCR